MSDAQQRLAADRLQRVLRARFRQQVKPGVIRTAAGFRFEDERRRRLWVPGVNFLMRLPPDFSRRNRAEIASFRSPANTGTSLWPTPTKSKRVSRRSKVVPVSATSAGKLRSRIP